MNLFSLIICLFLMFQPSSNFNCDGDNLNAKIRNNMNGDYSITEDLEDLDAGAFVVLNWREMSIMLPISFNVGEITFTDKKWLWSYQNNEKGLIAETPRLAHKLPNGKIEEFNCEAIT